MGQPKEQADDNLFTKWFSSPKALAENVMINHFLLKFHVTFILVPLVYSVQQKKIFSSYRINNHD